MSCSGNTNARPGETDEAPQDAEDGRLDLGTDRTSLQQARLERKRVRSEFDGGTKRRTTGAAHRKEEEDLDSQDQEGVPSKGNARVNCEFQKICFDSSYSLVREGSDWLDDHKHGAEEAGERRSRELADDGRPVGPVTGDVDHGLPEELSQTLR